MSPNLPLDPHAARLVGLWHAVPDWEGGIVTYFRFLEDLKYIGVFNGYYRVRDEPIQWRWQFMRVWMELEPNSVLRCRYKPDGSSWIRTFSFDGEDVILDVTSFEIEEVPDPVRKLYRCHRIPVEDLPEGVEEQFQKAMVRPWL